jgi:hypothetical protein
MFGFFFALPAYGGQAIRIFACLALFLYRATPLLASPPAKRSKKTKATNCFAACLASHGSKPEAMASKQ